MDPKMTGRGAKLLSMALQNSNDDLVSFSNKTSLVIDPTKILDNVVYEVEINKNNNSPTIFNKNNQEIIIDTHNNDISNEHVAVNWDLHIPEIEDQFNDEFSTINIIEENSFRNDLDIGSNISIESEICFDSEKKDSDVDDPDYDPTDDVHQSDVDSEEIINNTQNTIDTDNQTFQEDIKENDESTSTTTQKKKRKHCTDSNNWDKNINKKRRMLGQEYIGYTRNKEGVIKHEQQRPQRILQNPCESNFCKRSANRSCHIFSYEQRKIIFDKFWNMSWEQKRLFIVHMTNYEQKKRSYTQSHSRRNGTYQYFLKLDTRKHQVCKKTFLNTLGIKEKMVHHWVNEGKVYGTLNKSEDGNLARQEKKRQSRHSKNESTRKEHLVKFLQQLPKLESHYCRKRSEKLYLEQDFKSKSDVHKLYKQICLEENVKPLTIFPFTKKFDEMNLALFKPRKDQCDLCCAYKMKQIEESVFENHIIAKNLAREEKAKDKEKAIQDEIYCFTMDVQAVKLCPQLQASFLYYKTKLQVHNFTVYNLKNNDSKNYVWNETEADLSSSVFTTCIIKHLEAYLRQQVKPIVLFSDGCGYQNRNVVLANALSNLATKYQVQIEQKYLERGHTQMECDSTHSLIERALKGRDIYLPTDYIQIIKKARLKPNPLDVEYLDHTYFLNYNDSRIQKYSSIRPGKLKDDDKVNDLRCLQYLPNGNIFFKINYNMYKELPQRKTMTGTEISLVPLFPRRLFIQKRKWLDLQEMKKVIPKDTHYFYDLIQYNDEVPGSTTKKTKKNEEKQKNSN